MRKLPQKAQGKDRVLCPYIFRSEKIMTIQNVIDCVTEQRSERKCTSEFIIDKINEIEWKIKREIIDVHEGSERYPFNGYGSNDHNTELIAPVPYSSLYVKWVLYQLDVSNNAIIDASNSLSLFNKEYYAFSGWYTRNNMPLSRGNIKSAGYHI